MFAWLKKIDQWLEGLYNSLELRRREALVRSYRQGDEVLVVGEKSKTFDTTGVVVARTPDYQLIVKFPTRTAIFHPDELMFVRTASF